MNRTEINKIVESELRRVRAYWVDQAFGGGVGNDARRRACIQMAGDAATGLAAFQATLADEE